MKKHDPHRHAALQDEALTRLAALQLRTFLELVWQILEPMKPFLPNWHIDLLCEYLEAVTAGQLRNLVINMPPRYGKSQLVSVIWPVWEWIQHPSGRWLFVSYAEALAYKLSQDRRRILLSDWFQKRFGHIVRLSRDQQAKPELHNTRRGVMAAMSMGGAVTGRGGNRLVIDDPHSPEQAESDTQRQNAIDRFRHSLATRLDDKKHDATVVVMQRVHEQDLTSLCLDLDFEHLSLPAYEATRRTIVFPWSGRTKVCEPNEPLWPAREDMIQLAELRRMLGNYPFAAQYLQNPIPRVGAMFPREWWRWYDVPPLEGLLVQSWDLAFKDSEGSDFVVGLVALCSGANVYILGRFKARVSFTETVRAMEDMYVRFPGTSAVLVEDAANGPAVVDTLVAKIPGLIAVAPKGGKMARAAGIQPWVEAGQVHLPHSGLSAGESTIQSLWVEDFVETLSRFPKGAHDDDVDALTQLLVWWKAHLPVEPSSRMRDPEQRLPPRPRLPAIFPRRKMW